MTPVLVLIKGLGRGGAERLLLASSPHIDRTRFSYTIAYLHPGADALVPELRRSGLEVECLGGNGRVGWVRRLRGVVRDRRIGVVHVHSPYAAIGARLGLRRSRVPIVYTEHNVWESYHRATYFANAATYPMNRHVFAVSEQVRRSIRYPVGMRRTPLPIVETLYQGVDVDSLNMPDGGGDVRRELGVPDDVPVVGTIASFKRNKGHAHLVDAAATVLRSEPDTRFVLVGEGPMERDVRRRVVQLGLADRIIFAGGRPDAVRVARSFDVFVLSSLFEGLSIALLECMALGKPSVVTSVGGSPEVVGDGVDAYLVPPADPAALADRILSLIREPDLRLRMGASARRRAAAFDIRRTVARAERVYEEVSA